MMEQLPKLELARIACIQNRYFRLGIDFFLYIKKKKNAVNNAISDPTNCKNHLTFAKLQQMCIDFTNPNPK